MLRLANECLFSLVVVVVVYPMKGAVTSVVVMIGFADTIELLS